MTLTALVILHITYVMNSTNPGMNCILTALEQYEDVTGLTVPYPMSNVVHNVSTGIGTGTSANLNDSSGTHSRLSTGTKRERLLQHWRQNYNLIALKILPAPGSDHHKSLFETLRQWREFDSLSSSSPSYISSIAPNHSEASTSGSDTIDGNQVEASEGKSSQEGDDKKKEDEVKTCVNNNEGHCPTSTATSTFSHGHGGIQISSYQSTSRDYLTRRPHTYLFAYTRGHLMLTQEEQPSYASLGSNAMNGSPSGSVGGGTASTHYSSFSTLQLTFHTNHECFGPPSSNFLANLLTGYDIVVMNWAISAFGGIGYLYNLRSKELFNLNYASNFVAKKGVNIADMGRQRRESYRSSSVVSEVLALTKRSVVGPFLEVVYERMVGMFALIVDHLPGRGYGHTHQVKTSRDQTVEINTEQATETGKKRF
jgi:hypothetical protein